MDLAVNLFLEVHPYNARQTEYVDRNVSKFLACISLLAPPCLKKLCDLALQQA
jgi:hypothetical protein